MSEEVFQFGMVCARADVGVKIKIIEFQFLFVVLVIVEVFVNFKSLGISPILSWLNVHSVL